MLKSKTFLDPSEENLFQLESTLKELTKQNKPFKLQGGEIDERIIREKEFETLCAMIEENYHISVKTLSLYQFLSRLEALKEKHLRAQKIGPDQLAK